MTQMSFYFDATACVGCKACQLACKEAHDLPLGSLYRRVYEYEQGEWDNIGTSFVPRGMLAYHVAMSCNHCEHPVCTQNCPTGAMQKDPDTGIVWSDPDVCIGCRSCEQSCPYGAPHFREDKRIIGKCDMCRDLQAKGKDPVCVATCALRAIKIGPHDELVAKYGAGNCEVAPLPSDTTGPTTVLIAPESAPTSANATGYEISFDFEV